MHTIDFDMKDIDTVMESCYNVARNLGYTVTTGLLGPVDVPVQQQYLYELRKNGKADMHRKLQVTVNQIEEGRFRIETEIVKL